MQKYIETIMISATAVQTLSDICDKLRDIANEDNYSEEREDDLIRQLVESGRETMKIIPTVLDIYRDLNYGEQDENNQLVANYRILLEVYNTLNSIICSDNA